MKTINEVNIKNIKKITPHSFYVLFKDENVNMLVSHKQNCSSVHFFFTLVPVNNL